MAEVALEPQAGVPDHGPDPIAGRSPWALAFRRLRRNRIALAALVLFILIVLSSFAAPLYANHIAHTNPFENNVNGTTIVDGKEVPLMEQGGGVLKLGETPIGPDLGHPPLLPGGRRPGPRRHGAVSSTAAGARSRSGSARRSSPA